VPYTLSNSGGCVDVRIDDALREQLQGGGGGGGGGGGRAGGSGEGGSGSGSGSGAGSSRFEDIKRGAF
jgi:hypothetical protein